MVAVGVFAVLSSCSIARYIATAIAAIFPPDMLTSVGATAAAEQIKEGDYTVGFSTGYEIETRTSGIVFELSPALFGDDGFEIECTLVVRAGNELNQGDPIPCQ